MWYIEDNIVSIINKKMVKIFFVWRKHQQKDYNPLKQSKHIGLLIHDFTHMLIKLCTSNYA